MREWKSGAEKERHDKWDIQMVNFRKMGREKGPYIPGLISPRWDCNIGCDPASSCMCVVLLSFAIGIYVAIALCALQSGQGWNEQVVWTPICPPDRHREKLTLPPASTLDLPIVPRHEHPPTTWTHPDTWRRLSSQYGLCKSYVVWNKIEKHSICKK